MKPLIAAGWTHSSETPVAVAPRPRRPSHPYAHIRFVDDVAAFKARIECTPAEVSARLEF